MNKEKNIDKVLSFGVLLLFIFVIILYKYNIIAMHYKFGVVSLMLLFGLFIVSVSKDFKIYKKNIVVFSASLLTIVTIVIVHYISCTMPFKYYYKKVDDGIEITGYEYKILNNYGEFYIELPSKLRGMEVKSIGESAFYGSRHIYDIVIPKGVETIKGKAFAYTDPHNIILPDSLEKIDYLAFARLNHTSDFPYYVVIPKSVKYVGYNAFDTWFNVAVVENGAAIESWDKNWCFGAAIYYDVVKVEKIDGVLYVLHSDNTCSVAKIYPNYSKIKVVEKLVFDEEDYYVRVIGNYAGTECDFEEIIIPNTITAINYEAFSYNNNLKYIFIPDSVNNLGGYAFIGCSNVVINVEYSEKPKGWSSDWDYGSKSVKWNASLE